MALLKHSLDEFLGSIRERIEPTLEFRVNLRHRRAHQAGVRVVAPQTLAGGVMDVLVHTAFASALEVLRQLVKLLENLVNLQLMLKPSRLPCVLRRQVILRRLHVLRRSVNYVFGNHGRQASFLQRVHQGGGHRPCSGLPLGRQLLNLFLGTGVQGLANALVGSSVLVKH